MLCFRLSSSILQLAATCLLMTADVSAETAISCDDGFSVQRLSCESGVISVQAALYGRADGETCSEGRPPQQLANTGCSQSGTVDVLRRRCDGKRVCELNTNVVRTADPCPGIFKYLETNYTCFPAVHTVICEHSLAQLYCDEGQVILVYNADYGRRDQTTCSYQRPASQIQNVYCSNPTSKVAESCSGKNSCIVKASNSVFGDPCVGTYKYLEVAYTCQLRLSTTLSLAATCLLMTAGLCGAQLSSFYHVDALTTERVITCDDGGNVQRLSCESGVISVQAALYGRADSETCSEGRPPQQLANTGCSQSGTVDVLRRSCDGRNVCELSTDVVRTSDPCFGIYKYLDTTYACLPAIRTVACEHSLANLQCDEGQVIFVLGANYGRHDKTTCADGRPASQIQNDSCSRPTQKVAESCNGRSSCAVKASNTVFGDPCFGTFKYLDTTYACLPAIRAVACEHSLANLQCDEGQVIFVLGANYGRHDKTTCAYGRPASQIQNDSCSRPTQKVAESCNGRSSCAVKASNTVFGDPCFGTYKYLEIAYRCEAPVFDTHKSH
uniref:rhamnose-binding lectin-like n=1 Tax=Scatophagus argus TaxID=75038 RepID=UPI001ED84A06|nr:rhamnose-binding lectin-like [Scatophagus argus]